MLKRTNATWVLPVPWEDFLTLLWFCWSKLLNAKIKGSVTIISGEDDHELLTMSDRCSFEGEEVRYLVGVEIWLDGVARILKHWQRGNTWDKNSIKKPQCNEKELLQHTSRSCKLPERTKRVLQPPFCPKRISVSSLSPTMQICDFVILNLQSASIIIRDQETTWTPLQLRGKKKVKLCTNILILSGMGTVLVGQVVHHECWWLSHNQWLTLSWSQESSDHRTAT